MAPIFIKSSNPTQTADDAGVVITKRVFPVYNEGPYHEVNIPYYMRAESKMSFIPSLAYFCIKTLCKVVDRINFNGCPRPTYHAGSHALLLKSLIPFLGHETRASDIKYIDPLLWGTLIQLYANLPAFFRTYPIPLSDKYLPLLQDIKSTPDLTLITVVDLSACPYLTDDTIGQLKPLTNLSVFDMSKTAVSSWGIKMLSMCFNMNGKERFGPWGIRIWSMRGCYNVDNKVKEVLSKFYLLSVVDLRDTSVTDSPFCGFASQRDSSLDICYYPTPPLFWIDGLVRSYGNLVFAAGSQGVHILHVNRLEHPKSEGRRPYGIKPASLNQNPRAVSEHDKVLIFFPNGHRTSCTTTDLSQEEDTVRQGQQPRKAGEFVDNHGYSDNRCMNGSLGFDMEDYILANEIASTLVVQEEAQRQARMFYQERSIIDPPARRPNGLRPAIPESCPTDADIPPLLSSSKSTFDCILPVQSKAEVFQCETKDWERSFMFFRVPPAFDSIVDHGKKKVLKKQNPDDVILAKRKKVTNCDKGIPGAITATITGRMGVGDQQCQSSGGYSSCISGANIQERAPDSMDSREVAGDNTVQLSRNPFLAKKKISTGKKTKPSSSRFTSVPPKTILHSNPQSEVRLLASSTSAPKAKRTITSISKDWDPADVMRTDTVGAKVKSPFNMKAWATKKSIK